MKLLDKYLLSAVIGNTAIALAVLGVVFSFFALLGEINDVGEHQYGLAQMFSYLLLTLPGRLYELFPSGALIGTLVGLGNLAVASELVAMRAAGMSIGRIALLVLHASLWLGLAALLLGELVVPVCEASAQRNRAMALADVLSESEAGGFWARDQSTYVNIGSIDARGAIHGVLIYEFDEQQQLRVITRAEQGFYQDGGWILLNLRQTRLDGQQASGSLIPQARWESLLSPETIAARIVDPESMSLLGLFRYNRLLASNGQTSERYLLAAWNKLVQPFTTAVMVLLALPFCFSALRSSALGQRVFVGILLGLVFDIFNKGFGSLGLAADLNLLLSALTPTLLFFCLSLYLLRRVSLV